MRKLWFGLLPLALVLACSSEDGDTSGSGGGNGSPCAGAETFTANMVKTGEQGSLKVMLESSDPAPPARGVNTWMLMISDMNDAPVADATVSADPQMPRHGHGALEPVTVTSMGDGHYELEPVNLHMPGLWEVTIDVTPQGGTKDTVKYAFCIED